MPAREHVASASIKVKGAPLKPEDMDHVEKIEVRNFRGLPDMATIRMADPEGKHVSNPPFFIGDEIEIRLGDLTAASPAPVFVGEIVSYEPEFTSASAILSVRAYDKSHRMHRNRRSQTFQDQTVADVVRKVIGQNGLSAGTIDSTSTVHKHLQQSMESDLDFISRLAASENCEVGVSEGKVFLQKQSNGSGPVPTAAWRKNVKSFKPRMTASQQHDKVKVSSYDPAKKQAVVGEATEPGGLSAPAKEARDKGKSFGSSELLVADRIANNPSEAKTLAQSTLDKLASGSFEAEGVMEGDPAVKPGGKLKLEGFGRFDGEHHLSSVTHVYGHGDFRTRFAISGRNPRTLTDVMRPKNERDWTQGLVIGIVTNNKDPEKLGRVRVKFTALGDNIESTWARIALPGAGKNAGMAFVPMVGDEVVCGFEQGDTRRPVILGAMHNSMDKPHQKMEGDPDGGSLVVYGRKDAEINTQKKLVIAAKEKMELTVEGDYKLQPSQKIEIKAGSTISIEGTGAITIKSDATIDVKGTNVNVEAAAALKLKGATVDVQGSGPVNIKGAIINIG
jgi:uncharacterized protein involved in type VI secretion and phage assembly